MGVRFSDCLAQRTCRYRQFIRVRNVPTRFKVNQTNMRPLESHTHTHSIGACYIAQNRIFWPLCHIARAEGCPLPLGSSGLRFALYTLSLRFRYTEQAIQIINADIKLNGFKLLQQ